MRVVLMLLTFPVLASAGVLFTDDFEDNYIDDWSVHGQPGTWWAADGKAHGQTGNSWTGISPPGEIILQDCIVTARGTAVHTIALFLRLDGTDSGINATVSPDHDIAVIRPVQNGIPGDALGSINYDFPAGVWYEVSFSGNGDSLLFVIDIPSTGEHFEVPAIDPDPHPGECGLAVGDEDLL